MMLLHDFRIYFSAEGYGVLLEVCKCATLGNDSVLIGQWILHEAMMTEMLFSCDD